MDCGRREEEGGKRKKGSRREDTVLYSYFLNTVPNTLVNTYSPIHTYVHYIPVFRRALKQMSSLLPHSSNQSRIHPPCMSKGLLRKINLKGSTFLNRYLSKHLCSYGFIDRKTGEALHR